MNKSELVSEVQKRLGKECNKSCAEKALAAVLDSICAGVKKDKLVQIVKFGSFVVTKRAPRTGLNPRTKEKIKIPATRSVRFKPGSTLKDAA